MQPAADVSERLAKSGSNWILTNQDDTLETYNEEGRLISIADRAGQTITLTYGSGKLQSVRDAFNRTLSLSYDANNRLIGFIDPNSRTTAFGYDGSGRLATVTRPGGAIRTYVYNESVNTGGTNLPNALTGIVDETAQRYATFSYDAQGRANSSRHGADPGVGRHQLTYNANGTTTVTDPLGTARTFSQTVSFGVARMTGVSQPCSACGGAAAQTLTYDANGNVASRTDFNGNRTNYDYDLTRNLETRRVEALTSAGAITPRTRTITSEWHPTWRLPKRITEPKRLTTYVYNGDSDGGSTVTCGATGALCRLRLQATSDSNGAAGFGATVTGTPRVWNYTYNAQGQRLSEDGPRTDVADVTSYQYNASGNLTQISNALGHLTQLTAYDGNGRVLSLTDPNGIVSSFTYDYRGLALTRTRDGRTATLEYDGVGQLKKLTLPDASFLRFEYEDAQRLRALIDNLGNRRDLSRDAQGNIRREDTLDFDTSVARLRTRVFDALGRLEQDLGAQSQTTTYGYDANGNLTTVRDPRSTGTNAIVTTNAYDELNRLTQITDALKPSAGLTNLSYDLRDQLTQVRAPNNATTTYTLDGLGNLTQEASPDRGTTTYMHDAAGNIRTRTDARGLTATYTYDALNRLISVSYPSAGENVTLTYDSAAGSPACSNGIGRLCRIDDAAGTLRYAYDGRGNLTTVTRTELGQTYTTSYTYTEAERLAGLTTPTGKSFTYSRDTLARLSGIDGPIAGAPTTLVAQLAYNANAQVTSERFGNGVVAATSLDADARESGGSESGGGGTGAEEGDVPTLPQWAAMVLAAALLLIAARRRRLQAQRLSCLLLAGVLGLSLALQPLSAYAFDTQRLYDNADNLISRTNPAGTTSYSYDELNRLRSEAGPAKTQTFTYDANANRLSDGAGSYSVSANTNRYANLRGATPTYDPAGNLTSGLSTGSPPTPKSFTYNQAGRLSEVRQGATLLASYTYNGLGQRSRKALTAAGAQALGLPATPLTIVYHYDQAGNLLAETTSTGTPIRTYVWREAPGHLQAGRAAGGRGIARTRGPDRACQQCRLRWFQRNRRRTGDLQRLGPAREKSPHRPGGAGAGPARHPPSRSSITTIRRAICWPRPRPPARPFAPMSGARRRDICRWANCPRRVRCRCRSPRSSMPTMSPSAAPTQPAPNG